MQQHAGVGLEHRHVQHKERERQQQIDIVNQQGSVFGIVGHDVVLENKEKHGKDNETNERQDESPSEKAVVAQLGLVGRAEMRIEAQDGGIRAQLCQPGKEHGGIHHHPREADFFLCEQVCHHKKRGESPYKDTQIIRQSAFNALFCNNTHA